MSLTIRDRPDRHEHFDMAHPGLNFKPFALAGAEHIYDLGEMNDYEKAGLKEAIAALKGSIDKGIEFANK